MNKSLKGKEYEGEKNFLFIIKFKISLKDVGEKRRGGVVGGKILSVRWNNSGVNITHLIERVSKTLRRKKR